MHCHLDAEKETVRADCVAAYMLIVMHILCLGTCLGFKFGSADIKGSFMQSGPITRQVYVRPPRDCPHNRGAFWKLLNSHMGFSKQAGRGFLKIEDWMMNEYGLERVFDDLELFVKRESGRFYLII